MHKCGVLEMMRIGISYVAVMLPEIVTRESQTRGWRKVWGCIRNTHLLINQIKEPNIALVVSTSNRTIRKI